VQKLWQDCKEIRALRAMELTAGKIVKRNYQGRGETALLSAYGKAMKKPPPEFARSPSPST